MKKKDKVKGGIRMAVGLLLTVCIIFAGALLGGAMKAEAVAPTIDFSEDKTGSITIHKYEYNGNGGSPGTGKPGDSVNVPTGDDGAKPLEGVKFTVYQIENTDELKAIYQGIPAGTMPELSTYWDSATKKLTDAGKALTAFSKTGLTNPGTTDSTGVVTFANLPVGIYLVVETEAPPKVTAKSAPFLVSIPTTVDNNDWLYDVHVFPKNATTYGKDVTLIKKGSDNKVLEGVTFVLQRETKADDDTVTWETITVTDENDTVVALTTGTDGKITVSKLPPGNYRLIETNIGDNPGYIADFSKVYEFVVNDDGSIGRKNVGDTYIVLQGEGDPAATVATITVINEKPDVDKKVKDKDGNWEQEADYSVGDTISYQVAIKVPENIAKLKKFEVQDTPSGIKYKSGTLKVYEAAADGTMDADKEIGATDNYTLSETAPTNGFTVTFTMTGAIKDHAGKTIYITYDAVLTEDAVSPTGQVNAGNTNTVELIYSKYIKPTGEPEDFPKPPDGDPEDKIKDSTVVYTFQLDITKNGKTDGDPIPLQGVTFDLYKEAASEADSNVTDADAKAAGLDTSDGKKWIKINSAALSTDANGTISVKGLAAGTYYLVETQTNAGYNLLSKPIEVVLKAEYETEFTSSSSGNVIIKHEVDSTGTEIKQTITANGDNVTNSVTILNTKGFTLPTTGGAGGFLFAVVGCVVMIVGIILFKGTKKKPESE